MVSAEDLNFLRNILTFWKNFKGRTNEKVLKSESFS